MAVLHNHNRSTLLTCFLLSQSQSIDFFNHQASHYDRLIPSTIKPLNTTAHNQQHRIHLDLRLKYLRSTCTPSTSSIRPPVRSPSVSALILEIHVAGPPSIGLQFMAERNTVVALMKFGVYAWVVDDPTPMNPGGQMAAESSKIGSIRLSKKGWKNTYAKQLGTPPLVHIRGLATGDSLSCWREEKEGEKLMLLVRQIYSSFSLQG
ncbi:uncharacterized protein LOC111915610 isoform X2 [Lactuca sativa]|uniref:uncharacterized protein LOC111915610 isoform X2 n=1 Tax=Lactuca sativa TaxID=4236 RepID=UPI0022AFC2CC|nr:uncharacterized protein LOC111915610 isoform X2 [Lactuca sativa]